MISCNFQYSMVRACMSFSPLYLLSAHPNPHTFYIHVSMINNAREEAWISSYIHLPSCISKVNYISADVPQGSIIGPLLFLIYIKDIVRDIQANLRLSPDDTCPLCHSWTSSYSSMSNSISRQYQNWASRRLVKFNPLKTECLFISLKSQANRNPQPIQMQGQQIMEVPRHNHLGVFISHALRCAPHIECTWRARYGQG